MKRIGLVCIVIHLILVFSLCTFFTGSKKTGFKEMKSNALQLILLPIQGTRADFHREPVRAYVTRDGEKQKNPCFLLKVTGTAPGTRIYWSYRYESGPYNPQKTLPFEPFMQYENHQYNHWTDSSVSNDKGESWVKVRTSCYAGDRFQFGLVFKQHVAGFKDEDSMSIRFRNSILRSQPVVIWKRIFFENPKILKNVSFSQKTWDYVRQNLELLNIECQGTFQPITIDPADPRLFYYFYTHPDDPLRGKGKDPRYGPAGYGPKEIMLSRLNIMLSDQKKQTINLLVLGAISQNRDLIKNGLPFHQTPSPVYYHHNYQKNEMDFMEWLAYGSGLSMMGQSPAIIIWSDFWWLASKTIGVSHTRSLARVILHELGHHLLMFRADDEEKILDTKGHLNTNLASGKSMMTGVGIFRLNRQGKPYVSSNAIELERYFINNPHWHPKTQMLIRRDYIPWDD